MNIHLSVADNVAVLEIDRTEKRNALNAQAVNELDDHLTTCERNGVRAIILCGRGGHFCAGADLSELEDISFTVRLRDMLDHLAAVDVPTISAISGACMGLGMQLCLSTDIRVATGDSYFGIPVAKLGLMVDLPTIEALIDVVGLSIAKLMVLGAHVLDFDNAMRANLVSHVGNLDNALELGANISQLAPLSLSGSKIGFRTVRDDVDEAYTRAFQTAWASNDLTEGQRAFSERRQPKFLGN